ncbi:MAG: hypothetical protein WAK03_00950 [Methylocystis sp.]
MREIETKMVKRPQNLVRKSQMAFSVIAFGNRHCYEGEIVMCDTRQNDFGLICDYLAIPTEPHPAMFNATIRRWVLKFGSANAESLRGVRPKTHTHWHLDEMVVSIGGPRMYI